MSDAPIPSPQPVPLPPDSPTLIDLARASGIISSDQARRLADLALRPHRALQAAETQAELPAGLAGLAPEKLALLQGADTMAEPGSAPTPATRSRRASEVQRLSAVFGGAAAEKAPESADVPEEARAAWALPGNRFGKFVLVTRLGAGAMGDVWRAWQADLGRWVALKFLKGDNPEEVARFVQEARTAARLSHPNIVTTYEAGEHDGRRFIAMEYLEGADLGRAHLDLRAAVEAMREAARAVDYAHEQGVVHRDIKPANLFLTRKGRVCVTDFGLAKSLEAPSGLSQTGALLGTPHYMSPEQAEGRTDLDGRSDVFSLGATLYHLLAGRPPFTGSTWVEVLRGVLQEEPTAPRKLNSAIPREVETILLKALEKEPARRYDSGAALARDLDRWLRGEPIHARPASLTYRLGLRVRRHKAATTAISLLAATFATLGTLWWRLPGTLNLNVSPAGAEVRLAGRTLTAGAEPSPVDLPAGVYEVEARLADHETETREVLVERGRAKDLTLRLAHHQGRLEAESQPAGSEIEVDGVGYGSRVRNLGLDSGAHALRAWSAGHFERRVEATVRRGETARAFLWLEPAVAWVQLSSGISSGWGIDLTGVFVDTEDGAPELVHLDGASLVFRRPVDGRELRRISPASSLNFEYRVLSLGGGRGNVVVTSTEETDGLVVNCLDPAREGDEAVLWRFTGPTRSWKRTCAARVLSVGDRTGDGVTELAAGERGSSLWLLDGATGTRVANWPLPVASFLIVPREEGKPEVVLFAGRPAGEDGLPPPSGDGVVGALSLADGAVAWSVAVSDLIEAGASDLDGDGVGELRWRSAETVAVLDGRDGKAKWTRPARAAAGVVPAGVTDLDGDGTKDLLWRDGEGALWALSGKDGTELWRVVASVRSLCGPGEGGRLPGGELPVLCADGLRALAPADGAVRWTVPGDFAQAQVLDWDGDGRGELLAGERGLGIVCLDPAGKRSWAVPLGADVTPVGLLGDVDGDGLREIVIHGAASLVGVLRGPRRLWTRRAGGPLLAAPVVLDADGDGAPEVVQLGPWGQDRGIAAFDGRSGRQVWAEPMVTAPNRGPGVGDLDGNGRPELAFLGARPDSQGQRRLFVLHAADGSVAAGWPAGESDAYSTPAVVDLDGDGAAEVVVQTWTGQELQAIDGRTGAARWTHRADAPGMGGVAAGDLDGDGKPEVVAPFLDGFLHAVHSDGRLLWKTAIDPEGSRAPATLADLDGDGAAEALVVSRRGTLWVVDGRTGVVRWSAEGGSEGLGRPVVVRDPRLGIRVAAAQGGMGVCVYEADGRALYRSAPAGQAVLAAPAVADLDGDGRLEMAVGTWDGDLVVLDFESGTRLWSLALGDQPVESEPVAADLDGDGVLDLLIADHAGNLQAVSGRGTIGARRR